MLLLAMMGLEQALLFGSEPKEQQTKKLQIVPFGGWEWEAAHFCAGEVSQKWCTINIPVQLHKLHGLGCSLYDVHHPEGATYDLAFYGAYSKLRVSTLL